VVVLLEARIGFQQDSLRLNKNVPGLSLCSVCATLRFFVKGDLHSLDAVYQV
jgi:hypothetical protein